MSWEADSQLVRSRDDGSFNLAVGEPVFLQRLLHTFLHRKPRPVGRLTYPLAAPEPEFREQLDQWHGTGPETHYVVTCGAKQALHAAVYALKEEARVRRVWNSPEILHHPAPYWPSYPTVAEFGGMQFSSADNPTALHQYHLTTVLTSPNNPDGKEFWEQGREGCDIWDAAYASRAYNWSGREPSHRVSVWSAAKLLGCSNVRVGWLATEDSQLAQLAARYIEQTTSGVSSVNQLYVADILQEVKPAWSILSKEANAVIRQNAANLKAAIGLAFNENNLGADHRGMFGWLKVAEAGLFAEACGRAKIRYVSGRTCGASESFNHTFRFSLGLDHQEMTRAMEALDKELRR